MSRTNLKYRMYFLVLGSLQGINKGIQAGHAALEYVNKYGTDEEYLDFFENDKTFIILDGGTTNSTIGEEGFYQGSLNRIVSILENNDIKYACFYEPDIDHALTAVCFLADERVYDKINYPDIFEGYDSTNDYMSYSKLVDEFTIAVGGDENVALRNLLKGKKLAQ